MAGSRIVGPAVLATAALLVSGCGSATHVKHSSRVRPASRSGATASGNGYPGAGGEIPAPGPTGISPSPAAVKVIKGWSSALRDGNIRAAAAFFRVPSELINGVGATGVDSVTLINSLREAEAANASLPCGATFISADQRGPYVNALFRLAGRPGPGGSSCSPGAGLTARTNFLIRNSRIVQWIRAPDDRGDNGGGGSGGGGGPQV